MTKRYKEFSCKLALHDAEICTTTESCISVVCLHREKLGTFPRGRQEEKEKEKDLKEYKNYYDLIQSQILSTNEIWSRLKPKLQRDALLHSTSEVESDEKVGLKDIEKLLDNFASVTKKFLNFYMKIFICLIAEAVVQRLRVNGYSIQELTRAVNAMWWLSDVKTILTYALGFLGPTGGAIVLATSLGLLFTGWGALILLAGVAIGAGICYVKYKRDQRITRDHMTRIQNLEAQRDRFLKRYQRVGDKLEKEDYEFLLEELNIAHAGFESILPTFFPETTHKALLPIITKECCGGFQENPKDLKTAASTTTTTTCSCKRCQPCSICFEKLGTENVVCFNTCDKPHCFHKNCLHKWQQVKRTSYPNDPPSCAICRTKYNQVQKVVWI